MPTWAIGECGIAGEVDITSGGSRISQRRALQPQRGRQPIIWPIFSKKCMKMKNIQARGGARPSRPLRSATDYHSERNDHKRRTAHSVACPGGGGEGEGGAPLSCLGEGGGGKKLTAESQISWLYQPVIAHLHGCRAGLLKTPKFLRGLTSKVRSSTLYFKSHDMIVM